MTTPLRELLRPSTTSLGPLRTAARIGLGVFLVGAGISHLTWSRSEFLAQVPPWFPVDSDIVVVVSGIMEIAIGSSLIALSKYRIAVGLIAAGFFIAIFPGNISQYVEKVNAFGLNSDTARAVRLLFQPVLVAWALGSTGAWGALKNLARK
jgi:uncharacterized membrane protein